MKGIIAPRGTKDIYLEDIQYLEYVKKIAFKISKLYGYNKIITPTFEYEQLFSRAVGNETDVVKKEMFTFKDRADRKLALRPEGTAAIVRSVCQSGLIDQTLPLKVCYFGNFFRNERPQAGRYKEFYQFGVEMFGPQTPQSDAEIISIAYHIFDELKIPKLELKINSIGCENCRTKYKNKLIEYFNKTKEQLCNSCQEKIKTNPLRILDCKNEKCRNSNKNVPVITDYLCDDCKTHFEHTISILKNLKIDFNIDPFIVRGLDYYTKTVFEFVSQQLGGQNTVCGGGRYDNLVNQIGGKNIKAMGFAIGIERLILILKEQNNVHLKEDTTDVFIGIVGDKAKLKACVVADKLRRLGIKTQIELMDRSVKTQMRYSNKINAKYSCIIGDDEISNNKVIVKNMSVKQTLNLPLDELEKWTILKG